MLNVSYNCLDRHTGERRKKQAAIIWQGENEDDVKTYTYQQLHTEVCRFANVLKSLGVQKGDRVSLYLPMIPELAIAMLAMHSYRCRFTASCSVDSSRNR